MPSYLDLGVIAIVLISAALAMVRGFTREVLAIASWGAAAVAAIYFHPLVLPFVKPYISKDTVALAASAAIVFFATLIVVSIITVKVSDAILDSKVGPLDRSLGFVFGAARGLLLAVIAFAFFNWLVPEKAQPVPPIYQPEVAGRAIAWAAAHPRRREYWVGASTVATLIGNAVAPGILDRYLARTGFAAQQTGEPRPKDQPANLWEPADQNVDRGYHGEFDDRSKPRSPQLWASEHHGGLAVAGAAGLAAAATLAARLMRKAAH